jgi:large subunit ribosomal protein L15
MRLNEIRRPAGKQVKRNKRLGRGDGSGTGGTAGKGHKGQKARSGTGGKVGFEGGQMPLQRRLPKRGFTNIFRRRYAIVNLDQLASLEAGTEVTADALMERGLISKKLDGLKILGRGELKGALKLKVNAISESARKKVETAGGTVEVISG